MLAAQIEENKGKVEKLRAQNVAFEELIIPDELHDLLRSSNWIRAYRAATEFFDRKLAAGRTAMSQVRVEGRVDPH